MDRDELIHILLDMFEGREVELIMNLLKMISTEDLRKFVERDLDYGI